MIQQIIAWSKDLMGPIDWGAGLIAVLKVLRDPFSNVMVSVLLLTSVVVLVLLLAVVFLLAVFNAEAANTVDEIRTQKERASRKSAPLDPKELAHRKFEKRTYSAQKILILVGIFITLYVALGVSTQQRSVCVSCHNAKITHSKEFRDSKHNEARCSTCHEGGSVLEVAVFSTPRRFVHMISAVATNGKPSVRFAPFSNGGCNSCHRDVAETKTISVSGNKVKIAHAQPLKAGMKCVECHAFAKSAASQIGDTGMQSCLVCHNDQQESASCSTCHVNDPAAPQNLKPGPENAKNLYAGGVDCYTCHNPSPCDSCHGIRMPHPGGSEGYLNFHAADARSNRSRCYKCHDIESCRSCHFTGGAPVLE